MIQIEKFINNLQVSLTEILLAIDYRFTIHSEKELAKKYKSLIFFHALLDEYAILKTAILIDKRDNFHILKPYLKILSDKNLQETLSKKLLDELNTQKFEIENFIDSDFVKKLGLMRDKYLAHNDLLKRESIEIDMLELKELVTKMIKTLNKTCITLGLATIPSHSIKVNSLEDLIDALKMS